MSRPAPRSILDGEPINDAPIRTGCLRAILYCCDPDTGGVRFGVDGCPCCPKSAPGGGCCGNGFCGADEDEFDKAEARAQAKRRAARAKREEVADAVELGAGTGGEIETIKVTQGTLSHEVEVETSQQGYPATASMQIPDRERS